MKIILIIVLLLFSGCVESKMISVNGETKKIYCYGLLNPDMKNDNVKYQISAQNVIVGVILCETLIVPVLVLANQLFEPVEGK